MSMKNHRSPHFSEIKRHHFLISEIKMVLRHALEFFEKSFWNGTLFGHFNKINKRCFQQRA